MKLTLKELFSTPKKAALSIACLLVALATAGTCIAFAPGTFSQSPPDVIGSESAQSFAFADAGVDPVEAKAIQVKYERFQDAFVYDVEFIAGDTEYEYKIDAADGSVVKKESKTVKGPDDTAPLPGTVALETARETALADAGVSREQATFTEVDQDTEGGVSVYEFKFYAGNVEYEYEINAQTGVIYSKSMVTYVGQDSGSDAVSTPPPAQSTAPAQTDPPAQSAAPAQSARPSVPQPSSGLTPPSNPITPPSPPSGQSQQSSIQSKITADQAKSAALADAGADVSSVQYTRAELCREDGAWIYEVEFCTSTHEYEYEIDAHTGAVCGKSVEVCSNEAHHSGGHHADPHHTASGTLIGANQARSACLGHAGCTADQVSFTKVELDSEDGLTVYEIEFYKDGVKYEYAIDAVTGDVLEYEWEY